MGTLAHYTRRAAVFACLAVLSSESQASTGEFTTSRGDHSLSVSWNSSDPGTWVLVDSANRVCGRGRMQQGANSLSFPKIANAEDLHLVVTPAVGAESSVKITGQPILSPLSKPSHAAVIYQIPVRTYFARGNGKELTGKLSDVTDDFLVSLHDLGVDYIWLTGVLEHADLLKSDPDVVKGDAGSYYAVSDNWDVASALGGLGEIVSVIDRAHRAGIRVLIDFVGNHTARVHRTDIACKTDINFGRNDRKDQFFSKDNSYYYIISSPQSTFIPPPQPGVRGADGTFDTDMTAPGVQYESPAKVTGNDILSATPTVNDWFETAKLNYGFDLQRRVGEYSPRPRTWDLMVDVADYWLQKGVDGFRVDFAHSVPIEFWRYFAGKLKETQPNAFLLAEAYESDEYMKLPGFSYEALLDAGFDTIFNSDLYQRLKKQSRNPGDVRPANPTGLPAMHQEMLSKGYLFTQFVENHDEIRVASQEFTPRIGDRESRAKQGLAYSAFSALLPGYFALQGGQEVEEDASIFGPFAGHDNRTSIFDYIYQSQVRQWLAGQSPISARDLRSQYQALFQLKKEAPFAAGHSLAQPSFYDLSRANRAGDQVFWIMSYVRQWAGESYLVVFNSDPYRPHQATIHFTDFDNRDPIGVLSAMGIENSSRRYVFEEAFVRPGFVPADPAISGQGVPGWALFRGGNVPSGLYVGEIPAATTMVFKLNAL